MKRIFKRALASAFAAALLISGVGAASLSPMRQSSLRLAGGLVLQGSYLQTGSGQCDENVLYYAPDGGVTPVVAYGSTLYGRSSMNYIQQLVENQGLTVTAGVNASFFDMTTGIPYGLVVTDGLLRVSGITAAIGIREDGTFLLGTPDLAVTLDTDYGQFQLNYNRPISTGNGFCLYSRDYDYKTKNTLEAYHFILKADTDTLTVSSTLTATVRQVVSQTGSIDIPEGCFVLSVARDSQYPQLRTVAENLSVGDTLTVRCSIDSAWKQVVSAVGAGDMLVEDGEALSSFTLDSADRKAARTALGVTDEGEAVVLTVDQGESSDGMTLSQLAQRMEDLGCVTAINLDGGGSTTMAVTMPGDTEFTTVNHPTAGTQRDCANFIFFVRPTQKAQAAQRLFLYPYDVALLPGGSLELTVKATDGDYMPAAVPSNISFTAEGGTMNGNVFTAGEAGTATVVAKSENAGGEQSILIVETPTSISVRREDQKKALTTLTVEAGATVDLTADADYLGASLAAADSSFTWTLPDALGTVTKDGVLTAAEQPGKGTLEVSCGDLTVTIDVEVRERPFADTQRHWARNYIADLHFRGILNGSADESGKVCYRPEDNMTRQEFMVALMRYLSVDTDNYKNIDLPFDDTAQVASWAENAIKAAYKLGYLTGSQDGSRLLCNPKDTITREQAMSILARTMGATADPDTLKQFPDRSSVSSWAEEALAAMVEKGVVSGIDGKLQPQGKVTRAQVAKMLYAMEG